jgi:hypothetical protein
MQAILGGFARKGRQLSNLSRAAVWLDQLPGFGGCVGVVDHRSSGLCMRGCLPLVYSSAILPVLRSYRLLGVEFGAAPLLQHQGRWCLADNGKKPASAIAL